MKKYSISHVAQQLGLSKLISDAHETGQPAFLENKGRVVAMVVPCDDRVANLHLSQFTFGKVLGMLGEKNEDNVVQEYLVAALMTGMAAEAILFNSGHKNVVDAVRKNLIGNIFKTIEIAREISSEDSAMVGTNTSADEAEADKQGKRSVVSPAKSVNDEMRDVYDETVKRKITETKKKTPSAKSEKSPPTGGTASEGNSFEYRKKA